MPACSDPRQIEREGRALPDLALNRNVAAGLLGKAVDLGQPEARALADLLGGEERLEDLDELVGRDARSRYR